MLDVLRGLGIGPVAYSPLGRGFLPGAITRSPARKAIYPWMFMVVEGFPPDAGVSGAEHRGAQVPEPLGVVRVECVGAHTAVGVGVGVGVGLGLVAVLEVATGDAFE